MPGLRYRVSVVKAISSGLRIIRLMYPRAFHYHRAGSLQEAAAMLAEFGDGAKLLAGGQSLIPLMKLRFANPSHLVDLTFISDTSYIKEENGTLRFGALTRHAEIEASSLASKIPIIRDCAAGIADVQVRNRGTIGGSLAEADPSGDWATVLLTTSCEVRCAGTAGGRTLKLSEFLKDAYTTALAHDELVSEVRVKEGEATLRGQQITPKLIESAADAARAAADPQSDIRGSAEYKRQLVGALVKRSIDAAL